LLVATHFIKIKEPSLYSSDNLPRNRTLANIFVRSKSELVIANILTKLGIEFQYEKPLNAKDGSMRRPDFTITHAGQEFYWEHISNIGLNHWQNKVQWYKENGYFGRLIISVEGDNHSIDSFEIEKIAKEKILRLLR
jgi:exodeoxyribonuclease V alpha subunit